MEGLYIQRAMMRTYITKKNNKNKKECQDGEEFHREVYTIFIKNSQDIDYK